MDRSNPRRTARRSWTRAVRASRAACRQNLRGRSNNSSEMPFAFSVASVFSATSSKSAIEPLVMKIFEPFTTYSSPRRSARVRIACRSVPPLGSLIATPARISPLHSRGASAPSVPAAVRHDVVHSDHVDRNGHPERVRPHAGDSVTRQRHGLVTTTPPCTSGISAPSTPSSPASRQASRSITPQRSSASVRHDFPRNELRTAARHSRSVDSQGARDISPEMRGRSIVQATWRRSSVASGGNHASQRGVNVDCAGQPTEGQSAIAEATGTTHRPRRPAHAARGGSPQRECRRSTIARAVSSVVARGPAGTASRVADM